MSEQATIVPPHPTDRIHLAALAVERADQREQEDLVPKLHHRRRQFQ
jgi:hypothetical protein